MPLKIKIKHLKDITQPYNVQYAALKTDKFGEIQIGALNGAICFLYFAPTSKLKANVDELMKRWKQANIQANFIENRVEMQKLSDIIFSASDNDDYDIEVVLCGTDFQKSVWETLMKIPKGKRWTYSECAEIMGKPSAVRAVANAIASNEVAYLIPCHRVMPKDGNKIKYRWGAERKIQLLQYEAGIEE